MCYDCVMNENEEVGDLLNDSLPSCIEVHVPNISEIPEKAQQILALLACGFSASSIARLSGCTPSAVKNMTMRYDPKKSFMLTPQERRKFINKLWEARAGEALLHITPEKLQESSASELANIAFKASKASQGGSGDEVATPDPYKLINAL